MSRLPTSILILNWNSEQHLPVCLQKLAQQTNQQFEIIIIDNGSKSDTLTQHIAAWPELNIQLHRLPANLGFAAANNIGARLARGQWLALLNADAYPEPDWLENLCKAAEIRPGYTAFSSRQLQFHAPEKLDGAGDAYHISGLAWRNDYQRSSATYGLQQKEIFSACGAAALYARETFLNAGGFDEDYFSYFEDVDLGFRLRLHGEKCLYVPDAVVQHVGSASTGKRSDFSVYYGYRNMIWTFFKDMPTPHLWLFLPLHLITLLFFVIYLTARGQGSVILKAIFDAVRGLPKMLAKRREIQRNRQISSNEILRVMSTGMLEPYREFLRRNQKSAA